MLFFFAACTGVATGNFPTCDYDVEAICAECNYGLVYYCDCVDFVSGEVIGVGFDPDYACANTNLHCAECPGATAWDVRYVDCAPLAPPPDEPTTGAAYNCNNWDPGEFINFSTPNTYYVHGGFANLVESDFTPLFQCDSARINVDDGLVVEDAVLTDLAYLLGLRNGDELIEVNGMLLTGPFEAYLAYAELWVNQAETMYTLKVKRGTSYVYLNYSIIFMNP